MNVTDDVETGAKDVTLVSVRESNYGYPRLASSVPDITKVSLRVFDCFSFRAALQSWLPKCSSDTAAT